jgi:hypothetical protein
MFPKSFNQPPTNLTTMDYRGFSFRPPHSFEGDFEYGLAKYNAEEADKAAQVAAQRLKRVKEETPTETWKRVSQKKHTQAVKKVKAVAKKSVKKKQLKSMRSYFSKV